ncbi:MAG: hypothetical protein HY072_10240 [Deltaproteobacteria bacterium]|nr:hypothetical protein [Deltaproteobacteria bacterium]
MKKLKFLWIFIALFLLSTQIWTAGIVTITGKLTSITATQYLVETKDSIYYINRKDTLPIEAEKIKLQVSIAVPFDGITLIKSKHKIAQK